MRAARHLACILLPAIAACGGGKPAAAPVTPVPTPTGAPEMMVFTDDKGGYYVAADPSKSDEELFYYGDAKTLWQQRIWSMGADGSRGTWSMSFWSPRVSGNAQVAAHEGGRYTVTCGPHAPIALKAMAAADAKTFLAAAKLEKPFWKRQAHKLARDDKGTYFYVDRMQDEHGGKGHRVFVGQKGAMQELPMMNIVTDSAGEIYATKKGELRLVSSEGTATWIQGGKKLELVALEPSQNAEVIYTELGIYQGTLGTPCDEFDTP